VVTKAAVGLRFGYALLNKDQAGPKAGLIRIERCLID